MGMAGSPNLTTDNTDHTDLHGSKNSRVKGNRVIAWSVIDTAAGVCGPHPLRERRLRIIRKTLKAKSWPRTRRNTERKANCSPPSYSH